jgi:RimJ/RimL family protein N-acetyltransferase
VLKPPVLFETERLLLRKPRATDADAVLRYASDLSVTRHMSWPTHRSLAEAGEFLRMCELWWESGPEFCWAVTVKPHDALRGTIGCRIQGHAATLGYVLELDAWSRGYATEAARAVISWLDQQPAVYRVWAFCDVANPASARVLEKVGMSREGTLRRWFVFPNLSPEPRDCFVYAKVRGEA